MALHLGIKATYRQGVEENSGEGKDEGLKKKKKKNVEKLRCGDVCSQEGRGGENEEKEGLEERDKGAKKDGRSDRLR